MTLDPERGVGMGHRAAVSLSFLAVVSIAPKLHSQLMGNVSKMLVTVSITPPRIGTSVGLTVTFLD